MKVSAYTLGKTERISKQKEIDSLFTKGEAFLAFPLRIIYSLEACETASPNKTAILVSVSKRRFKRAVDRNRVKRLIREAYRLNKKSLSDCSFLQGGQLKVAFIYIHKEVLGYQEVEKGMKKAIEELKRHLS